MLGKGGRQASITPVAHDHGALTLSQLFEKLSTFQSQVSQAIVELEKQSEINTTWIPISESDTNHSIVKLALLVRLKEQASLGDTISWNEISKFLDQVVEYVPIDTDENFKTVVSGAVLNTTNSGLHTVSFRIREYLCTTILGLSGVFQFDQILELLRAKETRKQAEIRKEEARQRANTKLERLRGTGNLEGKSLLPQPPEGVDVIGWLSQQSWYRERIIVGAARQADASELQRAYPKHQFLFEKRYYEITLKKAEKMEKQNPGIIKLLLRFGITQLARYREDDLIAMYHFVLSEKNDSKNQPYYLHLSSAHDHNNSIL